MSHKPIGVANKSKKNSRDEKKSWGFQYVVKIASTLAECEHDSPFTPVQIEKISLNCDFIFDIRLLTHTYAKFVGNSFVKCSYMWHDRPSTYLKTPKASH